MIKFFIHKDTDKSLAMDFVKYHEAKGLVYAKRSVYVGINMGVRITLLIIDQKVFQVMYAYYRTCRVTHLMVSGL